MRDREIEINTMLEQERLHANKQSLRAEQEFLRAEQAMHQLTVMEEMLEKYRDRFGELPQ